MHRLLLVMMLVLTLSACTLFAEERNPHDGYVFWMPAGELVVGDSVSEKEFNYTKTEDGCTFTVRPREMRHGVPIEQLVIIAPNIGDQKPAPDLYIDGKALSDFEPSTLLWEKGLLGKLALVTFIPMELTEGKKQIQIGLKGKCSDKYLFYFTDDADKLGYRIGGVAEPYSVESSAVNDQYRIDISYRTGIYEFWKGNYSKAREIFLSSVNLEGLTPSGQRLFRRLARWADANIRYQEIKTGEGFYDLGLYSMVNGFYDLAEASFKKATELMPTNPDAWYMYADALSYKISDMHLRMERIYPFYQKAADLYPRENSNTWRNHIALFRNFRILEGDPPKEKVLHITDEQIEYITENWTWCTAIMEAASRGILRFENTYRIYDEEFDNRASWDPKPFMGKLFNRGEVETLMKFTDWTASDCCGMDTGPDRSSSVNIGIRTWDTLYHEWNHALDWAMTCPELGIGVPCTHSSDWTGFQPISSMGMGHHSTNRYYMTPGMYRYVRGTDPITTPHITDWLVSEPYQLIPDAKEGELDTEAWWKRYSRITTRVSPPDIETLNVKPVAEDGYVDLKATWPGHPKNTYAFAKTYVYSPKKQKVRMWIGADDNMRMWLNGVLIQKGTSYWSDVLFRNAKEKDQMAKGVMLEKGWNSLMVQITSVQQGDTWMIAPEDEKPDAWGFSVRICDMYNREVSGIKWQSKMPDGFRTPKAFVIDLKSPKTYSWEKVADDYTVLTPELTIDDLRAITGYNTMTATNEIFFDLSKENIDPAIKPCVIDKADPDIVALNNHLNWYFVEDGELWMFPKEMMAVVRYKRGNETRDLVFLRPEVYESYLKLLKVTPEAKKLGIKRHSDQVIGYFLVQRDDCPNGRIVLVVDTYLGDKLPVDEEDLLDIKGLR